MTQKSFGEFVRHERGKLDISLRELAKRVGISPPFLSDIELGRRYPSDEVLAALAEEFDIKVEQLKQYDHRESLNDFKRLVEEDRELGFAFRTAMDQVKTGKLSTEELAKRLKKKR